MRRLLVRPLLATALAVGAVAAEPAPSPLPPLAGELAGQLTLPKIPGLPALTWRVAVRPTADASLAFDATASAPGLDLTVALTLPRGDAPGTWRIVRSKCDASAWWHLSAEQAGAKSFPPDFELTGELVVTGAGEWRGADYSGALHVALAQGTAASVAQHWSATGFSLEGDVDLAPARTAFRRASLRVDTVVAAGITARNFLLDATGAPGGRLAVTRAEVAALGGRITLAPFTLDPLAPAVASEADFSQVGLGEIAGLLPQALAEARGQIAGRVSVNWSLKSGVGPGHGALAISPDQPATLRLAPSPGLLTGRSPERIALLPAFFGPLRKWTAIENPAHAMLRRIELGQVPLAVESLEINLYPDGTAGTRSAAVRVVARPTGVGDVVEKVTFNVNVSGPLDQVMRLGLDDRAKIRVNAAAPTKP